MIRLYSKNTPPKPDELDGKIVLREPGFHWVAVGHPRRVVGRTGSRLSVERLPIGYDPTARDGKPGMSTSSKFAREHDGPPDTWMVNAVRATCDTVEEAIYLVHLSEEANDKLVALKAEAKAALQEADGMELGEPEHAAPVPLGMG